MYRRSATLPCLPLLPMPTMTTTSHGNDSGRYHFAFQMRIFVWRTTTQNILCEEGKLPLTQMHKTRCTYIVYGQLWWCYGRMHCEEFARWLKPAGRPAGTKLTLPTQWECGRCDVRQGKQGKLLFTRECVALGALQNLMCRLQRIKKCARTQAWHTSVQQTKKKCLFTEYREEKSRRKK